jgi:protein-tyrosine phosphatase
MRRSAVLLLFACSAVFAATVENAKVELTGSGSYTISFQASPGAFPVTIYTSAKPDQSDAGKPVATALTSANVPVRVDLPAGSARIYFHLKPRSGPARVVALRRLPLEGAANFRDLGGYRTADGHHIRWGAVYRSGQLSGLTENDYRYLAGTGLRLVCDFRIDSERDRSPTKWSGGNPPEILVSSVDTVTYAVPGGDVREHMKNVYSRMPFDASAEFGNVLRRLARGDFPALVHCTAGKDRTGFFSALLLTTLGVSRETVREDFLLTNQYLVPDDKIPEMARVLQIRRKLDALPDAETVRAANGVDPANLDIAFRVITEKYGSFERYLRVGLKISDADLKALRKCLLEK